MDRKGKRTLGKSPWLERNLHETGVPVPGLRGVYLEPGGLTVLRREPEKARLTLLLRVALAAARRSRHIAFISRLAPLTVIDELTFLFLQGDFNAPPAREIRAMIRARAFEVRRFRMQLQPRFFAVQASEQTRAGLFKDIAVCMRIDEPDVFIIDAGVMLPSHAAETVRELTRTARQTQKKIWVLAVPAGRQWARLEKAAAAALRLREPAKLETAPALFIA